MDELEVNVVRRKRRDMLRRDGMMILAINRRMSPPVIYPNRYDWSIHDYTINCTNLYNNTNAVETGICTCAKGWRYVSHDRACGQ